MIFFTLILSFIVSSCQKEAITIVDDTANLKIETPSNSQDGLNVLEANLQWTAYMMSYILRNNQDIYTYVNFSLQNGDNVITLNELLENETINFEESVRDWFLNDYNQRPEDEFGNPDPAIGGIGCCLDYYAQFIHYLTEENCTEFYFPKPINFSGIYSVTTTAHPISQSNSNDAIVKGYSQNGGAFIPMYPYITIDQNYVTNNNNIIIARPYRTASEIGGPACAYTQYDFIDDFTDFLNGNSVGPGSTTSLGL